MHIRAGQYWLFCTSMILLLTFGVELSPAIAQPSLSSRIVGKWHLTFVESKESRDVEFKKRGRKIEGYYVTQEGETKSLKNISINNDELRFSLEGFGDFELKAKGDTLEGTFSKYGDKKYQIIMFK